MEHESSDRNPYEADGAKTEDKHEMCNHMKYLNREVNLNCEAAQTKS